MLFKSRFLAGMFGLMHQYVELTRTIGTFFNFVHGMRRDTRLTLACDILSHVGNSSSSVSSSTFNSKLYSSPSPRRVETLILSAERFLVNLKYHITPHHTFHIKSSYITSANRKQGSYLTIMTRQNQTRETNTFFMFGEMNRNKHNFSLTVLGVCVNQPVIHVFILVTCIWW